MAQQNVVNSLLLVNFWSVFFARLRFAPKMQIRFDSVSTVPRSTYTQMC